MMTTDFDARFERLYAGRYQGLRTYLSRLIGDADDAADLAQESFIRLHRRGDMPDDPAAWLVAVAHNLLLDQRRRLRRRLRLLTAWHGSVPGPEPAPHAADALAAAERRRAVRDALQRLNERDRRILLLKYSGYRYAEIAAAMSMPVGNVGTCLIRATAAFRRAIAEDPYASE